MRGGTRNDVKHFDTAVRVHLLFLTVSVVLYITVRGNGDEIGSRFFQHDGVPLLIAVRYGNFTMALQLLL